MGTTSAVQPASGQRERFSVAALFLLLGAGFLLRLRLAWITFLNPDEALHYYLAQQPSLKLAYQASLTTAHPPLMIIFLHYWAALGRSELFLRLPFVVAGTLFCWVMFLWVGKVANHCAAWFALALFAFSPPLISLSAEIRQYAFLLVFCACCLYFLERAVNQSLAKEMALSAVFLWLALLTHYSAVIFAIAIGFYALISFLRRRVPSSVAAVWLAGQVIALAICAVLFKSQISKLRQLGVPSEIAATWLRGSIFHPGEDHLLTFVWSKSLRLFRYFFSNGTIGLFGWLLFLLALVLLFSKWRKANSKDGRGARELAGLLLLPFVITLCVAIAGIYPYGGTRHDVLLAMFALPAIAIGLDYTPINLRLSNWLKAALLGCALLVGNFFPSPTGPYIRPRNQRRELMREALNSLPPNSIIFTDDQGSMVLNYYLCGESMALPFASQQQSFLRLRCGNHDVLVASGTQAGFDRARFPALLANTWQELKSSYLLYLFQSGWIDDKEEEWRTELRRSGGVPTNFGANILICPITQGAVPYPLDLSLTEGQMTHKQTLFVMVMLGKPGESRRTSQLKAFDPDLP